ncbi:MAG: hypothetical protein Q9205_004666 [Flavoplaca limonia]
MAQKQELRVLCFGASITAGFHSWGLRHHPYANRLKDRLHAGLPSHNIEVEVDGLSGDRVIGGEYLSRLRRHFNATAGKNERLDWLIFQGGGNDLVWGQEPAAIFDVLNTLWKISFQQGTKVMALTVTDTNDQRPQTRESYTKLNELIKAYQHENFFVADLFSKIQYAKTSSEMRKAIWDDGLHFKPAGYDMIGDAIADRLLEVIETGYRISQTLPYKRLTLLLNGTPRITWEYQVTMLALHTMTRLIMLYFPLLWMSATNLIAKPLHPPIDDGLIDAPLDHIAHDQFKRILPSTPLAIGDKHIYNYHVPGSTITVYFIIDTTDRIERGTMGRALFYERQRLQRRLDDKGNAWLRV